VETFIKGTISFSSSWASCLIASSCSLRMSLSSFFVLTIVYPLSSRSSKVFARASSRYKYAFFLKILHISTLGTLLLFLVWKALVLNKKLEEVAKELLENRENRLDWF